jgi:hypothetical protein
MKKVFFAAGCFLLLAAIVSGIWGTRAVNIEQSKQTIETTSTSLASGLSMQEMTMQSDLIIMGQCLETRSMWTDRRLVTVATVSVNETIKGTPASTISVVVPGGVDANIPVRRRSSLKKRFFSSSHPQMESPTATQWWDSRRGNSRLWRMSEDKKWSHAI